MEMTKEELAAYIQALEDTGVYDPSKAADDDYVRFMEDMDLKEEIAESGNWYISVKKNYGTIFEKEFMRVFIDKDGTVSAGYPRTDFQAPQEILVGKDSVIKMFCEKLLEQEKAYRKVVKERKDKLLAAIRKDTTESKDGEPGVPLSKKGCKFPKVL